MKLLSFLLITSSLLYNASASNIAGAPVSAEATSVAGAPVSADFQERSRALIEELGPKAIQTLTHTDISLQERQKKARELLSKFFDMPSIARFTMGANWRKLNEKQKTEFVELFEEYLVILYANRFEGYEGASVKVKGKPLLENNKQHASAKVTTEISRPGHEPLQVIWRVFDRPNGPKILDVFIGNVSMGIAQRSEFSNLLQHNGGNIAKFFAALREQIDLKHAQPNTSVVGAPAVLDKVLDKK